MPHPTLRYQAPNPRSRANNSSSSGSAVELLQRRLRLFGLEPGRPGRFDLETETAVRRFQAAHGLEATGVVESATWDALFDTSPASLNEARGATVSKPTGGPASSRAALLGIGTVSQGGRGSPHAHHCYLAACTTVLNYLTGSRTTMDEAWERTGRQMPPADRIRTTFTRLGMPAALAYMAGVTYSASPVQLRAIGTSIANGWPMILGIGKAGTSTAAIGHYIVLGGVDSTASPTQFQLLDPWAAEDGDPGVLVPAPKAGGAVPGLRASKAWVALEVYFAKGYKARRPS